MGAPQAGACRAGRSAARSEPGSVRRVESPADARTGSPHGAKTSKRPTAPTTAPKRRSTGWPTGTRPLLTVPGSTCSGNAPSLSTSVTRAKSWRNMPRGSAPVVEQHGSAAQLADFLLEADDGELRPGPVCDPTSHRRDGETSPGGGTPRRRPRPGGPDQVRPRVRPALGRPGRGGRRRSGPDGRGMWAAGRCAQPEPGGGVLGDRPTTERTTGRGGSGGGHCAGAGRPDRPHLLPGTCARCPLLGRVAPWQPQVPPTGRGGIRGVGTLGTGRYRRGSVCESAGWWCGHSSPQRSAGATSRPHWTTSRTCWPPGNAPSRPSSPRLLTLRSSSRSPHRPGNESDWPRVTASYSGRGSVALSVAP